MRRVPIRMKLAGALAVPLLALVVVTALEVVDSSADARMVSEQVALAESSIGPVSLLSHLENERNAAAVYLLGAEGSFALPVEDNAAARDASDAAVAAFRSEVENRGGEIEAAYRPALDQIDTLDALRVQVDAAPDGSRTLQNIEAVSVNFDGYSAIMDPLFEANKRVALAVDDPELRRGAELIDLSARQTNTLAILVRDLILAGVGDGVDTPQEIRAIASGVGQLRANERSIQTKGTGIYEDLAVVMFQDESVQRFPEVVDEAIATGAPNLDDVILHSAGDDPETFGYTVFRQGVTDTLSARGDDLESAAEARQRWFIVLAILAVTVAVLVTWLVSRSITKPLRSLTRQAKEMAERRLPEAVIDILETPLGDDVRVPSMPAVVVNTRDEVADVSDALNTVQDTALDLAVEQAVLRRNIADSFVNLGRRNQNLLGRQLDFITELESHEADAETLANLFRLDHLATRMRRNAESLLVLAGIEPPRQWAAPVRLTDVIRAALGEVEDYQRVTVRGVEPATILGSAAADLAHLMAELIENALVFSPPDQSVDIRGRNHPDGYTLAIIDSGLGMPPDDIVAANRRLAGAESFTIAPSKYLGHYVAGNLAARHDIQVHLENSPGNGVTATIDIPPTLLTTDTALAAPVTPPHGTRAITAPAPAALQTVPIDPAWTSETPDWLMPAEVDPGVAAVPPAPPPQVRRTESGLTKRTARQNPAAAPLAAETPTGDLLDTLSRHTARLHGGPPSANPQTSPGPAPSRGWDTPSGSPATAPATRTGGRSWPLPPEPVRLDPTGPGARQQPAPLPHPEPLPLPDPSSMPGPPQPFTPTWTPSAAPDDWLPPRTIQQPPRSFGPEAAPGLPSREQPGAPAPAGDDTTTGGLARRVRGAQLPATEPVRMRRPAEPNEARSAAPARPAASATPPTRTPPVRTPEQRRQADDVYNFLSSFTAGVQRGLEEATHDDRRAPGEPHPDDPRWR